MTANQEADRIILDAHDAANRRYGNTYPEDRLSYYAGVLQAHIKQLCHEAHETREELKKVQQELLWERKNG